MKMNNKGTPLWKASLVECRLPWRYHDGLLYPIRSKLLIPSFIIYKIFKYICLEKDWLFMLVW